MSTPDARVGAGMPSVALADSTLGQARQHLTAAINHSLDGRDTRTHRHLDAAITMLYEPLDREAWTEVAGAKVLHQRGDCQQARQRLRDAAQRLDAELEGRTDA